MRALATSMSHRPARSGAPAGLCPSLPTWSYGRDANSLVDGTGHCHSEQKVEGCQPSSLSQSLSNNLSSPRRPPLT